MGRPRKPPTEQARIAQFAYRELHELVDDLNLRLRFSAEAPDVLGALVLAARRLPLEVVRELMPDYVARSRAALDALAEDDTNDV